MKHPLQQAQYSIMRPGFQGKSSESREPILPSEHILPGMGGWNLSTPLLTQYRLSQWAVDAFRA